MKEDTIEIPMKVHSRNQIDKMHWSRKRKLRQDYQLFVRSQMSKKRIRKAKDGEFFKLRIIAFRKRAISDFDNLVGGCKQLIDALSNELFIWDDSTEYIGVPEIVQAVGVKIITADSPTNETIIIHRSKPKVVEYD